MNVCEFDNELPSSADSSGWIILLSKYYRLCSETTTSQVVCFHCTMNEASLREQREVPSCSSDQRAGSATRHVICNKPLCIFLCRSLLFLFFTASQQTRESELTYRAAFIRLNTNQLTRQLTAPTSHSAVQPNIEAVKSY